jgi:hypothetical protein
MRFEAKEGIHPEIRGAVQSVNLPEVQEIMKRLSDFGLGIMVPHAHADDNSFIPLDKDMVQVEDDHQVSFRHKDAVTKDFTPVGWRWDSETQVVALCTACSPMPGCNRH